MDNLASGWFISCTDQCDDLYPGYRNVQVTSKGQYGRYRKFFEKTTIKRSKYRHDKGSK